MTSDLRLPILGMKDSLTRDAKAVRVRQRIESTTAASGPTRHRIGKQRQQTPSRSTMNALSGGAWGVWSSLLMLFKIHSNDPDEN